MGIYLMSSGSVDSQTIILGVCVIAFLILLWWISTSNKLNRLKVKVDESESCIDVALTKRYDTLTKMLDVCRNYANHELEVFTNVIQLRSGMSMKEKNVASAQMDQMQKDIGFLAESYPELGSNAVFIQLQNGILDIEDNLSASRRLHNSNVSIFNQTICQFPTSIVANAKNTNIWKTTRIKLRILLFPQPNVRLNI